MHERTIEIKEVQPFMHCQYFRGRRGQCSERSPYRIRTQDWFPHPEKGGHWEVNWLYVCFVHLNWWFDDLEKREELEQPVPTTRTGRPYRKRPPDAALIK